MYDIEDICNKYYQNVYKYLISLSHNSDLAEELTQETFCVAIKEINKFKGNCEVITWLCVIAKHLYYKHSKQNIYENIDDITQIHSSSIEEILISNLDDILLFANIEESYIAKDMDCTEEKIAEIFKDKDLSNGILVFINDWQDNDKIVNIIKKSTNLYNVTYLKRLNMCDVFYIK